MVRCLFYSNLPKQISFKIWITQGASKIWLIGKQCVCVTNLRWKGCESLLKSSAQRVNQQPLHVELTLLRWRNKWEIECCNILSCLGVLGKAAGRAISEICRLEEIYLIGKTFTSVRCFFYFKLSSLVQDLDYSESQQDIVARRAAFWKFCYMNIPNSCECERFLHSKAKFEAKFVKATIRKVTIG